jgi:protein TonB
MRASITKTLAASESGHLPRMFIGVVVGLVITLFLFWFMQYMIEIADKTLDEGSRGSLVDFVRVRRDETPDRTKRKPEKPPPPDAPPEQPPTPQLDNLDPSAEKIAIQAVPVTTEIEMTGGFSLGVGEGDYLPIVKVAPIYPQRALTRGVEGYCVVEYTVTRQGTTRDPVVVENQCTSSLFHRASLQAALKFKYKPRIIDGEAVEVRGVQNKFTYEIVE